MLNKTLLILQKSLQKISQFLFVSEKKHRLHLQLGPNHVFISAILIKISAFSLFLVMRSIYEVVRFLYFYLHRLRGFFGGNTFNTEIILRQYVPFSY